MKRQLLAFSVALAVWVVLTAASASSQSTAIAIASIVGIVLPFVLKFIPAAGHYMLLITLGVSLLVAVAAELISGEIVLSNLQAVDAKTLFALFLSVWGLSQIVYAALSQSPKTASTVQ